MSTVGWALIPSAVFAAVPNYPVHLTESSSVARALISATRSSQQLLTLLCAEKNSLQEHEAAIVDVLEDPGYSTIGEDRNQGKKQIPKEGRLDKQKTIENVQFTPVITTKDTAEATKPYEVLTYESLDETAFNPGDNRNQFVHPDVHRLYAVPAKKPVAVIKKILQPNRSHDQIQSLETLKLMKVNEEKYKMVQHEDNDVFKFITATEVIPKQRAIVQNILHDDMRRSAAITNNSFENADFLFELQFKLEKLISYIRKYMEENQLLQHRVLENEQAKVLWRNKLKEAQHILEDNMIFKTKLIKLEDSYSEKENQVQTISQDLISLRGMNSELIISNRHLQDECDALRRQCQQFSQQREQMIPIDDHNATMFEIQSLLETLKQKYAEESNNLQSQLKNANYKKECLKVELTKMQNEVEQLQLENHALNKAYKESHRKCLKLLEHLKTSQQWGDEAQVLLATVLSVAEHAEDERDCLRQKTEKLDKEQLQMLSAIMQRSAGLHNLKDTFEDLKGKIKNEVENISFRVHSNQAKCKNMREKCQQEIQQLRKTIIEKEQDLKTALHENKMLQTDLKNLWKLSR